LACSAKVPTNVGGWKGPFASFLTFLKKPSQSTVLLHLSTIELTARQFWAWLQSKLRRLAGVSFGDLLIDSTSIEVVLAQRVSENTENRFNRANICKKTIRKCWYFGRKLHLLVSSAGILFQYRTSKASMSDAKGIAKFKFPKKCKVTGDGGYRGQESHVPGRLMLTKPWGTKKEERFLASKRVTIEQKFGILKELGLEGRHKLRCQRSLDSHIVACLACVCGIQLLNLRHGLSPLSYAHFCL
jgi:hypothetical protein